MTINLDKRYLKAHKEQRHQDESIRTCHICHKILFNRSQLYLHYVGEHPNENCPVEIDGIHVFQCEYCQKILSSIEAHYTHIKLVHKLKKSSTDIKLTKKQQCQFCETVLNSAKDFIIHLVNIHPEKEPPEIVKKLQKVFKCVGCGDTIVSPSDFYRHLKYNHEKILNSNRKFKPHTEGV